ncbi:metallophosphoesterase [Pseudomonas asplenii]|uniref:metallophosphoesterase n=1 Tax=Pseudomonas asplenii TaxID=53407 RepID=UPI002234B3E8|nr:metallophosphoesterase [Pseudomonas asplenii]UZE26891.1 hypothetical protein LOY63_15980 [Pseudomonas asplenii]
MKWMSRGLALVMACGYVSAAEVPLKLVFMGDTQQREILGATTGFSAKLAQDASEVAVRSSEQEVFAKYVMRSVMEREHSARAVIHLGDLLDYSCESEWMAASAQIGEVDWKRVLLAPGNHDGLFQGNNGYGGAVTLWLRIRKLFDSAYDPMLQGHFNAVCKPQSITRENPYENYEFRKRDFFCSYLEQRSSGLLEGASALQKACAAVSLARKDKVTSENRSTAIIDYPADGLLRIGSSQDPYSFDLIASFPQPSTAQWGTGYFVQAARFSLGAESASMPLHVVLLDTTDWSSIPHFSFFCCSTDNSGRGVISKKQRDAVEKYVTALSSDSRVIFAGHYPLKDLEEQSANWLKELLGNDPAHRMYFSAHTHAGYISSTALTNPVGQRVEINTDSMIDWPVSYWTMEPSGDKTQMCFTPHDVWSELGCEQQLAFESGLIEGAVKRYKSALRYSLFNQGEAQWRWRAEDAARALKSFAARRGLQLDCPLPDFDRAGVVAISDAVQLCGQRLDSMLSRDPSLRIAAACTSLLGGSAFVDKPVAEMLSKRPASSRYQPICL